MCLGISSKHQSLVFRLISSILHMGNIDIEEDESGDSCKIQVCCLKRLRDQRCTMHNNLLLISCQDPRAAAFTQLFIRFVFCSSSNALFCFGKALDAYFPSRPSSLAVVVAQLDKGLANRTQKIALSVVVLRNRRRVPGS